MPKYGQFIYGEQLYGEGILPDPNRPISSYRKPLGTEVRRKLDDRIIFQVSHGGQQRKKYHIPDNPQTEAQQAWRAIFITGVTAALALSPAQQEPYKTRAKKKKGQTWFTIFMSDYLWDQSH